MTVMVTRRTLRRTHLLRPDDRLNELYRYSLAVIAKRHGIEVHAAVLMSTHEHLIVSDPLCRLPMFLRELHRMVALGVKVLRKWEGAVWDHGKTSVVELRTPEAVIEKLAYIMANPVAAGLVRHAHEWPGLTTRPDELGTGKLSARRPGVYLDADNPAWPERAELYLTPAHVELDNSRVQQRVATELERLERIAYAETRARGWCVLGAERVARLSPSERATSWEPTRDRNPHFAVGRGQRKAFFKAVAVLRTFRRAYHSALELWRTGARDVPFPAGTWLMRVLHEVRVVSSAGMLPVAV